MASGATRHSASSAPLVRLVEAADLFSQVADLRRFVHRGADHIPYATHPDDYLATVLAFISRGPMF